MRNTGFRLSALLLTICLLLFVSPVLAVAQDAAQPPAETAAAAPAPAVPAPKVLSIDDVITLSQAGLSEDVIIAKIKKNGQAFDLSPDQLLKLKTAKVTDRVIQYMLDPAKVEAAPVVTAGTKPAIDPSLPEEAGVYWKKTSETTWNELLPEVVNWKTGGMLKGIASYGMVKKDVNGHINGKSSKTSLNTSAELLIVAPDGIAITEYLLLRLHQNGDNREFRSMTGGVFHASGGASRDAVEFQNKKIAPHRYVISLQDLKKGEYGILPPGATDSKNAAGSTGKVYSFSMLE